MNQSEKRTSGLAPNDRVVLDVIKSKGDKAIWINNIVKETKVSRPIVTKCVKTLQDLALIAEVLQSQFKGKHYIASEFKPAVQVTGGSGFVDGKLDTEIIGQLKKICLQTINTLKVVTSEGVYDFLKKKSLIDIDCTIEQISQTLRCMVLDNDIIEVISSGRGEDKSIPIGNVCYRRAGEKKTAVVASAPCDI